jgi:two-component system, NtrC family, response regulator HydG
MPGNNTVTLVIIDDNEGSLEMLSAALAQDGLRILTANDPEEGLDLIFANHPQIVLTDLVMPKMSGMEVLERVVEFDPSIDVILMTAYYTTETAVEAIRKGAADYLNKPVSLALLRERTGKLLTDARRRQQAMKLEDELLEQSQFEGIIGHSPAMWELFSRIRRIAPHYRTALITGETGTGKDLVARALHRQSPVSQSRFVVLNCSAVVETLFESELFGHVRGAFTGADREKAGLVEHADGGTLFLDEIGDMPLATQAKMLRVLQNQEVQRVGSLSPRKVNVRVIAATNRNLEQAVANREFREDLYYRLAVVDLNTPPLRERREDLPLLIRFFLQKFTESHNKEVQGITQRAQLVLTRHPWPGNVRELENAIAHACMMTLSDVIDIQDLPKQLTAQSEKGGLIGEPSPADSGSSLDEQEKALIGQALAEAGGNQSEAARRLRIGRDALRYKMKKHGLLA